MTKARLWLLIASLLAFGCRTTEKSADVQNSAAVAAGDASPMRPAAASPADPAAETGGGRSSATRGGYFVAVPADASLPVRTFYEKIYAAIDALGRQRAHQQGRLKAYVDNAKDSGYAMLQGGPDEIECDRRKCLIKLTARAIGGEGGLARQLIDAAVALGVQPLPARPGRREQRYIIGDAQGMHVDCARRGTGKNISYRCDFNIDQALLAESAPTTVAMDDGGRGKLSGCANAPGTVRDAEETKSQQGDGGLLPLTGSPSLGAKVVGYLRFARNDLGVEILDMYLCGDLSQDHFPVDGAARQPRSWIPGDDKAPTGASAAVASLNQLRVDETALNLRSRVVEVAPRDVVLEVKFRIVPSGVESAEGIGEDRFYVRLDKSWLQPIHHH